MIIFFMGLDLSPSLSFGKPGRIAKAKRNLGNLHAQHAFYQVIDRNLREKNQALFLLVHRGLR